MKIRLSIDRILRSTLPIGTGWLLADCMEARGKQDLWIRQKPELIEALRELAMIQSVESSNRIEGVTVAPDRLRPVIIERARPRDRPEEELAGYRRALDWIFKKKRPSAVAPRIVRHLHALAQHGSGDAGIIKQRDNEIIEFSSSGARRVRFKPTPARQTPAALRALCASFEKIIDNESCPVLLAIGTFVLDFLCIHPFRDGNGRVSRLLTTLLLQQHGFAVGRFVSLERLIEERKAEYYDVLGRCSVAWHSGENELAPWWNFLLGIVRSAYREFEDQVGSAQARPAKTELIRRAVLNRPDAFTLADIVAAVPSASPQMVKKVLAKLKMARKVRLVGRGRGARWQVTETN